MKYNKNLVSKAQELRKEMTPEETKLWYEFLRSYPVRFVRQKVLGQYIADFYCSKAKLVVELDGAQHYDEETLAYDKNRTKFISEYGIVVLRFMNRDVHKNFPAVCEYIDFFVQKRLKGESLEGYPTQSFDF